MEGFERGRNLDKIGQHAQDTAELFFDDVQVPKENLLGEEGAGFVQLMTNLPQERLSIAARRGRRASASSSCPSTTPRSATAFGRPIGKFQHNRFVIAEMATEARIARVFVDDCVRQAQRAASSTPPTPRWRSGGPPSCRRSSSTRASSCTAATAT